MHCLTTNTFYLGFLPRFLIVGGDADLSKMRPTGPLAPMVDNQRRELRERLVYLHTIYNQDTTIEIPEANTELKVPTQTEVVLTNEAWEYFQKTELLLVQAASESGASMVAQPTFSRLAWSAFKMAMLFAACRQEPQDGKITVELTDLQGAVYYVQKWGVHTIDLILNVGRTANQRTISRIYEYVKRKPGVTRSEISRMHHLSKKELDVILDTLIDRGQVRVQKAGNGWKVHPN